METNTKSHFPERKCHCARGYFFLSSFLFILRFDFLFPYNMYEGKADRQAVSQLSNQPTKRFNFTSCVFNYFFWNTTICVHCWLDLSEFCFSRTKLRHQQCGIVDLNKQKTHTWTPRNANGWCILFLAYRFFPFIFYYSLFIRFNAHPTKKIQTMKQKKSNYIQFIFIFIHIHIVLLCIFHLYTNSIQPKSSFKSNKQWSVTSVSHSHTEITHVQNIMDPGNLSQSILHCVML